MKRGMGTAHRSLGNWEREYSFDNFKMNFKAVGYLSTTEADHEIFSQSGKLHKPVVD